MRNVIPVTHGGVTVRTTFDRNMNVQDMTFTGPDQASVTAMIARMRWTGLLDNPHSQTQRIGARSLEAMIRFNP